MSDAHQTDEAGGAFIPLSEPCLRGNEWAYVKECLDTGWVSSVGSFVTRFEDELAARVGTRYAVATVNGTAALHIALLIAGVEPEDEVLVSTLTFVAPTNAIRYVGAWPVFMDAEPEYWQMDPQKVHDFLSQECAWKNGALYNKGSGRRVRAIVPVHILGHPCDMDPLVEVARRFELSVIEDASEALGSTYRGRAVGSLGDAACFSFNGNKIVTAGGGGMLLTDNPAWAAKAKYLTTQAKDDPIEFVHNEIGYNYRQTNVLAALGTAQLELLDGFIAAKRQLAARYDQVLAQLPGCEIPREAAWASSNCWLYTAAFPSELSRPLQRFFAARQIQVRPLWRPNHRLPPHRDHQAYRLEVADQLHARCLSLPCSVSLTEASQARVLRAIGDFMDQSGPKESDRAC